MRMTQRYLRELGIQRRGEEEPTNQLTDMIRALLQVSPGYGTDAIWQRLRREKHILVKRYI